MQNLCAQVTSNFLQFPDATVQALQKDEIELDSVVRASFTTGRTGLAWLACGPQLEVINSLTGERLSAYRFSGVTDQPPTIVAVKEFSWQKKIGLLVALVETEGSVLCLYDVGISRVVKAVVLPGSVTAVEAVINHGGASASTQHLHQSLRWFFGVAAVVTDVGHVLLIDLCLDDASGNQDELEASDLEVMSGVPAEIPKLREAAAREHRQLCLQLKSPSGTAISALNYISKTNQLVVGFTDGYLSLWNMKTLRKECHVQIEGGKIPVSAVTFQEPENDPRNCCYLWAVQATHSGEDVSLHLLQLAFGDRKCSASGHIIYEHLEYCEERYSLDLSASSLSLRSQTNSTKLLGCQTIEKLRGHSEREDGLHEATSPDTSVTVFSWQVNTYGQGKPSIYMAVFDINRWYQAQMPDSLSPGQLLRNCSYFAFWSLETVLSVTQENLLDILVHERSFGRGVPTSYPPPEQFYYPSTYSFDATCLVHSGVIHITCTGFQKETLHFLKNSSSSLNETVPAGYSKCLVAGLLSPRLADVQPSSLNQEEQLQALLSAAVETSSISLLTRCVKQWTAEEQPRSAANLRFVLGWTWNKVIHTKKEFDRLCIPLFDGSCNFIDSQTLQSLQQCQLHLANLTTVLNCFITEAQELTTQGLIDLTNKQSVTKILSQYASVVLWFCRCGLLPDYSDETVQLTRPYYNYSLMQQYYADRRKKLDVLSRGKWNSSSLMIDSMVSQLGEKIEHFWKRDGGTGKYPPASLHALLDLYLLENAEEITKHAITIYFLLDIMYSFSDKPNSAIESFPTAFSVPCGLIKLIQGFWLLDHNDSQNSVDCVLHPAASRLMTWQHNQIIETLMCQGDHRQALRYIQVMKPPAVTTEEARLHITVLLTNKNLIEAWNLQRFHSTRLNKEELLKHMYETCQEMGLMEDLLKLTFDDSEQAYLHSFLQTRGCLQNQELLLVHHLQKANYISALQLNQSLKSYHMSDSDHRLRERAMARNSIMDHYSKVLPRVQRKLARAKPYALSSVIWKEVTRPKPLSTVAKEASLGSVITKASFISNVLKKVKEVSSAGEIMEFSPYKNLTPEEQTPLVAPTALEMPDAFVGTPRSKRVSRLLDSVVHPILAHSLPLDTDFEFLSEKCPSKPTKFLTSSPVQPNLLKIAVLKNLAKTPEFNLLETPIVVKRAKALATNSVSSIFMPHTPQSILRSSARTTPLASPSVSPGRSVTPPLRPRESKISFLEQITKQSTKEMLTPDQGPQRSSLVPKSSQDTVWTDRISLLTENASANDLDMIDEPLSPNEDGHQGKIKARTETSNVSARSDQTTLAYDDATVPEDFESDENTVTIKSRTPIKENPLHFEEDNLIVAKEGQLFTEVEELQERDAEEVNHEFHSIPASCPTVLQQLTVQKTDLQVESGLETLEDNEPPGGTDPDSSSSSGDSACAISIHDSEDIVSAHSEPLNEEMEVEVLIKDNGLLIEEIPVVSAQLPHCMEEEDIKENKVSESEPGITYIQLYPDEEIHRICTSPMLEQPYECDLSDGRVSVDEMNDADVENAVAPSNFSLILDVEDDEAAANVPVEAAENVPVEAANPANEGLKELSEESRINETRVNQGIKVTDNLPENDFVLLDYEQKTNILGTVPNVPQPDLPNVLKETPEVISELSYENEDAKVKHVLSSSRTHVDRANEISSENVDKCSQALTPPKISGAQRPVEKLEISPLEVSPTLHNPQTPRRRRKASELSENTSEDVLVENPPTPRRGRKPKGSSVKVKDSSSQEEHVSSRVLRTRSFVLEKTQNTKEEFTGVQEVVMHVPTSPGRTRRGKTPILNQINEGMLDPKVVVPVTPPRTTRSSKIVHETEVKPLNQKAEMDISEQIATPSRRQKNGVNELVKHFEQNTTKLYIREETSPPVSLKWSRIKSKKQIETKISGGENIQSNELVPTLSKRVRKFSMSKHVEETTEAAEKPILTEQDQETPPTTITKRRNLSAIRRTKKSTLPSVSEESVKKRVQVLHPQHNQEATSNIPSTEGQPESIRSRTRSRNALPDNSSITFLFTTPTPKRRRNPKAAKAETPVSPEASQPEYVFSPPSLRRKATRNAIAETEKDQVKETPQEPVINRKRGRPPKPKASKEEKPTHKSSSLPPSVEIQLLSPPESPAVDLDAAKPTSTERKASSKKPLRRNPKRIISKPVTRRKIR